MRNVGKDFRYLDGDCVKDRVRLLPGKDWENSNWVEGKKKIPKRRLQH